MKGLSFMDFARNCVGLGMEHASGNIVTVTREVSDFHRLLFLAVGDVVVTQGSTESLTITSDDDIVPHLVADVSDGTLALTFDSDDWRHAKMPSKGITYNLSVRSLDSIQVASAGNVQCAGLKTDSLSVDLSGAGTVTVKDLQAASVATKLSGAGHIELAGQVRDQDLRSSGAGSYGARGLQSERAAVLIAGAGSATVWATAFLDVMISGLGSVSYYGNPAVNKTISGLGRVKSMGNPQAYSYAQGQVKV